MDLLRRAAVFEDQRNCLFTGRGRPGTCSLRPGLIGRKRLFLARIRGRILVGGPCLVSFRNVGRSIGSTVVLRIGRIVEAEVIGISEGVRTHPSITGNSVGNSRPVMRYVRPAIAPVSGIGRARQWTRGNAALETPGEAGSARGGVAAIPGRSGWSGSGEPSTGHPCGMTREASVRRSTLGAGGQHNKHQNQRNRGEALHKDILRPNAIYARAILTAVDGQPRSALSTLAVVTTWPTCRWV